MAISALILSGPSCDERKTPSVSTEGNPAPERVIEARSRSQTTIKDEGEAPVRRLREPRPGAKPSPPVAVEVPGKPNFVFSPYNNKMIDVTGLPGGTLVADPSYPAEERKYFRIPQETGTPP